MSKREIKAKRWARRRLKRTNNLIRNNIRGYLRQERMGERMLICGRQSGMSRLTRLVANIMTGNTGGAT